jgi:hypothetical protein
MFQFPGFASLTLCIQVKDTCLTRLLSTPEGNNNQVSGGLPHSEIHGSKPVPGSPWLIAGYHVLHRLLLPRHPPNALVALDSTRKEQGRAPFAKRSPIPVESLYIPMRYHQIPRSVVLDLEQFHACTHPEGRLRGSPPTRGDRHETDVFLSQRCQAARPDRAMRPSDDQTHDTRGPGDPRIGR